MKNFVKESLKLIDILKPFPLTVIRINNLLSDPFYSTGKLINMIRYDAPLTADILKMANAPYFGAKKKLSNIRQAVSYLGAGQIRKMLFLKTIKPYFSDKIVYEAEKGELWHSSVAGGVIAEILANFLKCEDPQIVFTASLLRDIGKIIIGKIIGENSSEKQALMAVKDKSFDEEELLLLGTTHSEIGAVLLSRWRFPDEIIDAVTYHHNPLKSSLRTTRIVAMSDLLTMLAGITTTLDGLHYKSGSLQEEFNLTTKDIDKILAKSITKYNSIISEFETS